MPLPMDWSFDWAESGSAPAQGWWTTGASISGGSMQANTQYLILGGGMFKGADNRERVGMGIYDNEGSGTFLGSTVIEPTYSIGGELKGFFAVSKITTDATPSAINVEIGEVDAGASASWENAWIVAINLDEIPGRWVYQSTDLNQNLTTSQFENTMVEIVGSSLKPDTEYIIFGHARFDCLDVKGYYITNLWADQSGSGSRTKIAERRAEGEDVDETRLEGFVGYAKQDSTSSQSIAIFAYAGAVNDWHAMSSHLIAIELDAFEKAVVQTDNTSHSITTSPNTQTTIETISNFDIPHSSRLLVVGDFNYASGGNEARVSGQAEIRLPGTADQSSTISGTVGSSILGGTASSGENDQMVGQTITPGTSQTIYHVSVGLERVGTVPDDLVMRVWTTDFEDTLVATSAPLDGGFLTLDFATYLFSFPGGFSVTASTVYYVTIERTGPRNETQYARVWIAGTPDYSGGQSYDRNSNSWTAQTNYDWSFAFPDVSDFVLNNSTWQTIDDTQTQTWDPADAEPVYVHGVSYQELAGRVDVHFGAARHASDSNPSADYQVLSVLTLAWAEEKMPYGEVVGVHSQFRDRKAI